MVEVPILKFLFSDDMSLNAYLKGEMPVFHEVKRRILANARAKNTRIADHHYQLAYDFEIPKAQSVGDLILIVAKSLSENYLTRNAASGEIHVKSGLQCDWQQIIPFVAPLFAKASFLYENTPIPDFDNEMDVWNYCDNYVFPVCTHTAIPPATCSDVNRLSNSFSDIHIHLNGSGESDVLWQNFLDFPTKIYRHLSIAYEKSSLVAEQLEQESHLLKPLSFHNLLRSARKMRKLFYDFLVSKNIEKYELEDSFDLLYRIISRDDREFPTSTQHPFEYLLPIRLRRQCPKMALECLMFIKILDCIKKGETQLEPFFHLYLLIYGLSNKLVVQQPYQYGFDQFQKITLNRLRDLSELTYDARFLQISGNQLDIGFNIEGRFSPKLTQQENLSMIASIEDGWEKFLKSWTAKNSTGNSLKPDLKLVAHFIKQPDDNKNRYIRHYNLRTELWKRGKILSQLLTRKKYKNLIVGIDAAANELHASPEVFAPVFRKMRRAGINRVTYHVGEDFVHPLSGLRSIFEAIDFLDLRAMDRIGHGTAMGVNLQIWMNSVGKNFFMKSGEWLDDLIFVLYLLRSGFINVSMDRSEIEREVSSIGQVVYGEPFSIDDMIQSWKFRKFCPILSLTESKNVRYKSVFDQEYFDEIQSNLPANSVFKLFRLYHSDEVRERFRKVEKISPFGLVSLDVISEIQDYLLKSLRNGGVAIETLPTSNVRISCAKDFSEYHLLNWERKINNGDNLPKIVVGTDDPGIFSTNLLNEFACIYELLISECSYTSAEATARIDNLVKDAALLRF